MKKKDKKKLQKELKKIEKRKKNQRAKRGYADEDVWNMYDWFLNIAPKMLKKLRKSHIGHPMSVYTKDELTIINGEGNEDEKERLSKEGEKRWNEILDKMIFLLEEANENTCSMKNPFEQEAEKLQKEFRAKYGLLGEGYKTDEEKALEKKTGTKTWRSAADAPENKELFKKYYDFENQIDSYRNKCKNEFFKLCSEYFWDLWD